MKNYWLSAVALIGLLATAQGQPAPITPTNAAAEAPFHWGSGLKVLIVSGGYWHDFDHWFVQADSETLRKAGIISINSTSNAGVAARELSHADVMIESANYMRFDTPEFRDAVSNFAKAGKGLVLMHSGVWYNWAWPEYNAQMVSSVSRSHDGVSQFDETVVKDHPVTHGLPATFKMTDELYHPVPEPGASPIDVLAEASRPGSPKYPSVWVVHYGKARIVCITLGHDGSSHNSPEYQKLLVNAVNWAGQQ